jgi:hypothetical protein
MLPKTTTTDDLSPKIRGEGGTSERDRPHWFVIQTEIELPVDPIYKGGGRL